MTVDPSQRMTGGDIDAMFIYRGLCSACDFDHWHCLRSRRMSPERHDLEHSSRRTSNCQCARNATNQPQVEG